MTDIHVLHIVLLQTDHCLTKIGIQNVLTINSTDMINPNNDHCEAQSVLPYILHFTLLSPQIN